NEPSETIQVNLSGPTNANLGGITSHTYTIVDDDKPASVAFTVASSKGSEAVASASLRVDLSAASSQTVMVHYAATGGTAGGPNYTLAPGTLTFNPGELTKYIPLTIRDDGQVDPPLTVQVTLDSPINASLGKNSAHTYTILDADTTPTVAF